MRDCWQAAAIIRDNTERKRAEQERQQMELQLRQAHKLEAVGQLAAGIAHEINTPTQFIGDNTRFVQESFTSVTRVIEAQQRVVEAARRGSVPPELLDAVDEVREAEDLDYLLEEIPGAISQSLEGVRRVAKIVQAMKAFSHPGSAEKTQVNLNQAIESTVTVCRNEWKYVAEVELDLAPDLPPVPCLPGEFNQVVLNLVINAAHAIADGAADGAKGKGRITLGTRREGEWVEVRVSDTGQGIPDAIRDKIFDPFFTTKEVGKGTGQGLAIARSVIVDKHGGSIDVESQEGHGTTFTLRLPLQAERDREQEAA